MNWIWTLPILLTTTMVVVLYPLFSRYGNLALPRGLEDDPRAELEQQRELLLHQLKEWQLEGEGDAENAALRHGLEHELADVLTRLDLLQSPSLPSEGYTGEAVRNPVDMAFGVATFALLAVLAGGLYLGLGTTVIVPSATTTAAASQEDIRTMVAQLAQRLEKEPDNIVGWMRLARSWAVLGDFSGAVDAYTHVLARQSDNLDAAVGLAEIQVQSGESEQVNLGAVAFAAILEKDPNRPEALWSLGAVAARSGDVSRAVELWQRLLPILAEDAESRTMVENAIQDVQSR